MLVPVSSNSTAICGQFSQKAKSNIIRKMFKQYVKALVDTEQDNRRTRWKKVISQSNPRFPLSRCLQFFCQKRSSSRTCASVKMVRCVQAKREWCDDIALTVTSFLAPRFALAFFSTKDRYHALQERYFREIMPQLSSYVKDQLPLPSPLCGFWETCMQRYVSLIEGNEKRGSAITAEQLDHANRDDPRFSLFLYHQMIFPNLRGERNLVLPISHFHRGFFTCRTLNGGCFFTKISSEEPVFPYRSVDGVEFSEYTNRLLSNFPSASRLGKCYRELQQYPCRKTVYQTQPPLHGQKDWRSQLLIQDSPFFRTETPLHSFNISNEGQHPLVMQNGILYVAEDEALIFFDFQTETQRVLVGAIEET